MRNTLFFLVLVTFLASCSKDYAKLELLIDGARDSSQVVISKLDFNKVTPIDTIIVVSSKLKTKLSCAESAPEFYYAYYNSKQIASLVALPGERIKIVTDTLGAVKSVDGSDESMKLLTVENDSRIMIAKFNSLANELAKASDNQNAELVSELKAEMGRLYVKRKQAAIKYIFANSKSISVIPLMYQKITPELPLFSELSDALIFARVYDSLHFVYPNSKYIVSLADEIDRRNTAMQLNSYIENATVSSFPDISLYDYNSEVRTLSEYEGNVLVVMFWSALSDEQKMFNAELKEIYEKYHSRGLEVYQVSLDADKVTWVSAIRTQGLEWVCVNDPLGVSSTAALSYGVTSVPSLFIFDKEGNFVERDLFDIEKLDKKINSLL